jgi:hypothetical protein
MSNSPWEAAGVYEQIQAEIRHTPALAQGSLLILDESADENPGGTVADRTTNTTGEWAR